MRNLSIGVWWVADIFLSYTNRDQDWAFWIGQELKALGHAPHIADWELSAGSDILAWMEERLEKADHVLCVVSAVCQTKSYSNWERRAAGWAAQSKKRNIVLPVFVEDCQTPFLLAIFKRCDLFGLSEDAARKTLADYLAPAAGPTGPARFPGSISPTQIAPSRQDPVSFPGAGAPPPYRPKAPYCFVVMGFGQKTAFYYGQKAPRVLDLDKTYLNIIKRGVEAAGLTSIRDDEIQHTGLLDQAMFNLLLDADAVVADLSTSNANAIYELGVRHALRPNTTIVVAESDFTFPFDISQMSILRYEHLGENIGTDEAVRVSRLLCDRLRTLRESPRVDSPVYALLPALQRPTDLSAGR